MKVTMISNVPMVKQEVVTVMDKILEKMGQVAESHAKEYCPVDTGNLRNSITHQKFDDKTEMIGTPVEYAPYVELGTRRARSQPYLRPAVENHWSEYKEIMEKGLKG